MIIEVCRVKSNADETVSLVYVDDVLECFGLEDEPREVKVYAETRIPAGEYLVTLRNVGGFHERYAQRFGDMHEGMLWIREVQGFEYILIHCGNKDEDTAGCLLVGQGATLADEMTITASRTAYKKLYTKVVQSAKVGKLTIKFTDLDQ